MWLTPFDPLFPYFRIVKGMRCIHLFVLLVWKVDLASAVCQTVLVSGIYRWTEQLWATGKESIENKGIEKRAVAVSMALAKAHQPSSELSHCARRCVRYQRVLRGNEWYNCIRRQKRAGGIRHISTSHQAWAGTAQASTNGNSGSSLPSQKQESPPCS